MSLNQETPSLSYTAEKNLRWCDDHPSGEYEKKLDVENLLRKGDNGVFMPFMVNSHNAVDVEGSFQRHALRFRSITHFWPRVEKLSNHYKNKNHVLFNKNAAELGYNDNAIKQHGELGILIKAIDATGSFSITDNGTARQAITQFFKSLAKDKNSQSLILKYFEKDRKGAGLWQQMMALRKQWNTKFYYILSPIYLSFDWDQKKYPLDNYELCQKRFDELKGFYVDCFETFCRLSVLAAALECATKHGKLEIQSGTSALELEKLEAMANGNKHTLLSKLEIGQLFIPFIDSKLRNGLGHHSARHNILNDCILYENNSPQRGLEQMTVSYTRFCEKVIRLYAQLESISPLLNIIRFNYPDEWFE